MTRSNYFIAAGLLWAMAAAAQQTGSISGAVTNSVTGAPVPKAHVSVRTGFQTFGAMSSEDGKFSITGLTPNNYSVSAERVGFVKQDRPSPQMRVQLRAADEKATFDLKLTPVGGIAGHVLDTDGAPLQLAHVTAEGLGGEGSATTDNKGRYHIGGLAPGKYHVRASLPYFNIPPEIRTDGSKEVHYIPTAYASRVAVSAGGETSGIDIPLETGPFVNVTGKVVDVPAGAKHVSVEMMSEGQEPGGGFRTAKADGAFVFWGVYPGKYTLQAAVEEPGDLHSAPVEFEVSTANIERLELRLVPPFDIAGALQFESDEARKAAGSDGLRLVLSSDNQRGGMSQAEIAPDGTFKLEKAQPGRYQVEVQTRDQQYVRWLRLGTAQIEGDVLDVRNSAGGAPLTVMMSAETGAITGTVRDDQGPARGAAVMLMKNGANNSRGTSAGANGDYSLPKIPPGVYKLWAGDENTAMLLMSRGGLTDYDGQFVTVGVHPGDKLTQDLKPASPDK